MQTILRVPSTGDMDPTTVSRLRGIQSLFGVPVTGILDKATMEQINKLRWMEHAI